MRDAIIIPIGQEESLVITSDNSGSIGMKEDDMFKVSYETVGYYSFRVAVMECMASGAIPIAVIIHNFCGDDDWNDIVSGVHKGLAEIDIEDIQITGSTESNFPLKQSALGINVIGRKSTSASFREDISSLDFALIGLPLIGNEVITQADQVVPLSVFKKICKLQDVCVWSVGSKGVLWELKRICSDLMVEPMSSNIDLLKSGGPATSFLVFYHHETEEEIKRVAGEYFHKIY